jgi:putative hydrolase of the HAD superfamily
MVGDNMKTDMLGAQQIGMKSVFIKRQEKNAPDVHPTYEIAELAGLLPIVESLADGRQD